MLLRKRKTARWLLVIILLLSITIFLPRIITALYAKPRLFTQANVPPKRIAIVFGAGLSRDGSPSPVLRDRIATAAQLYFAGKVDKMLMSGDNRFVDYNEPGSMRAYALSIGVPEEAIVLDFAGRSTYDTCYRAGAIFGVKEAVLITQRFHLPRALYTCNHLGVQAVGVEADQRVYSSRSRTYWGVREFLATLSAFWELYVEKPLPVLGDPEPITFSQPE